MNINRRELKSIARRATFNKNQIASNFAIAFVLQAMPYGLSLLLILNSYKLNLPKDGWAGLGITIGLVGLIAIVQNLVNVVGLFIGNLHLEYDLQEITYSHAIKNIHKYFKIIIELSVLSFIYWLIKTLCSFILSTIPGKGITIPVLLFFGALYLIFSFKFYFVIPYMVYNDSTDVINACNTSWNVTSLKVCWEIFKLEFTFMPFYISWYGVIYLFLGLASKFPLMALALSAVAVYLLTSTYSIYKHTVTLLYWDTISSNYNRQYNSMNNIYPTNYENQYSNPYTKGNYGNNNAQNYGNSNMINGYNNMNNGYSNYPNQYTNNR